MTRNQRVFLTVFLVILLGGLGVSGASALWSTKATVTAQVTAGTWVDYSRPGFDLPLTVTIDPKNSGPRPFSYDFTLNWTHGTTADLPTGQVTYELTANEAGGMRISGKSLPSKVSEPEVSFRTTRPILWGQEEWIELQITPTVQGVKGTPTTVRVHLDWRGNAWLTSR